MEKPVFYDGSGRRWRRVRVALLWSAILLSTLLFWAVSAAHQQVAVPSAIPVNLSATVTPHSLAYSPATKNLPIIGSGPLVRVVKIGPANGAPAAFDPFSGTVLHPLTTEDVTAVQGHFFAIERYGRTTGRRLVLTFDDGPDPIFTPQILNILSKEGVRATFFIIGQNTVKFPKIAQRLVREGHEVGNHTLSHADFDFVSPSRAFEEINATERLIRAVTGRYTAFFRLPYGGNEPVSLNDNLLGLLQAQQLGYMVVAYDFDTNDWQMTSGVSAPLPPLDGGDQVILLHDSGGNRSATVAYLSRLIAAAKAQGYTFATLNDLYPATPALAAPTTPTPADRAALALAQLILVVPSGLMYYLFLLSVSTVLAASTLLTFFAVLQSGLQPSKRRKAGYHPFVSVVVPAYNEEKVLGKTIRSLLKSRYQNFEILIVDDGSTDGTATILHSFTNLPQVRMISKRNGGKASALNVGLKEAKGEIVVTLDADTVFTRDTIGRLIKHFANPKIGAVAGVVKVGNTRNLLTAWQALEYITGISIDRRAHSLLGTVVIVPGACAAWRKVAIEQAGGHSAATLAEDCDLTLAIHKTGYRIIQENGAVAYTEAPQTLTALAKQRFRWTFGNLQALWKHRDMLLKRRYGILGTVVLPYTVLSIVIPVLFVPLIYLLTVGSLLTGNLAMVGFYFILFTVAHLLAATCGILLARDRFSFVLLVPLYRLLYDPLRTYLLYVSIFTALKGSAVRWYKLPRVGTVKSARTALKPAIA